MSLTKPKQKPSPALSHEIHPIFSQRWSPRAFSEKAIDAEKLSAIFEAARWTASAFNEQPWAFIYAQRGEKDFEKLLDTLAPGNQLWAKNAGVLMIAFAKIHYSHNGKPNQHAWYDVGQAVNSLILQAGELGIYAHQMAGFSADKALNLGIQQGYEPVVAIALGHLGDPEQLPENLKARELAAQQRNPQEAFVFKGTMNE